jgi:hypothetical protein
MKLASAGSLEAITKLIAEFYFTTPDRIALSEQTGHWSVRNGEKAVSPIVVRVGRRFVFGVAR